MPHASLGARVNPWGGRGRAVCLLDLTQDRAEGLGRGWGALGLGRGGQGGRGCR